MEMMWAPVVQESKTGIIHAHLSFFCNFFSISSACPMQTFSEVLFSSLALLLLSYGVGPALGASVVPHWVSQRCTALFWCAYVAY